MAISILVIIALWIKFGWFWGLMALIATLIDIFRENLAD